MLSMTDNLSKEKRSKVMASIKAKNTKPELIVRKFLWGEGIRYRIHDRSIFGTPDISIKKKKIAIFVDGCFWHGCKKCYKEPRTNVEFWRNKIARNKQRRNNVKKYLKKEDWHILEVWEHMIILNPEKITQKIIDIVENLDCTIK